MPRVTVLQAGHLSKANGAGPRANVVNTGLWRQRAYATARECPRRIEHAQSIGSGEAQSTLEVLEQRGLVKDIAGDRDALDRLLTRQRIGAYAGIDPTAPSMHLGHLLPLMVLFWLHGHGHHTTSLIGGATSQVGDPSGRLISRQAMQASVHKTNLDSMTSQVRLLWANASKALSKHGHMRADFEEKKELGARLQIRNNATWIGQLGILEFLTYMGTAARLGTMLGRDTVKNKLTQGDGMSFAEFTYPLLQAWDWWYMYKDKGVVLQVGGSDQYGNIVAGMDAIKHVAAHHPQELETNQSTSAVPAPAGLTVPLLTTSSGAKFGKSAGNAIWLDKELTSTFDLYGYLLKSPDAEVERYLKSLTFLPLHEISKTMEAHIQDPGQRKAQHLLAQEVVALVHGEEEATRTDDAHKSMRRPTIESLTTPPSTSDSSSSTGASIDPTTDSERIRLPHSLVHNTPMSRILYHAGVSQTRSEGLRLIQKGGVYAGSPAVSGEVTFMPLQNETGDEYLLEKSLLILRVGKWKVRVVEIVPDAVFDEAGLNAPGWDEFKTRRDGPGS